ncbi:MAG: N-acetylmuramoyl-L-alanine amidase [Eubacterium sp.]|nr:N-acetylmuramoyl-L-alanine amidase [Eubacterium sp.]
MTKKKNSSSNKKKTYKKSIKRKYRKPQRKTNKAKKRWKQWKERISRFELCITLAVLLAAFLILRIHIMKYFRADIAHPENLSGVNEDSDSSGGKVLPAEEGPCGRPEIRQLFLTPNSYSRSRIPLKKVKGVVIHYVANPGSSAVDNRDYFESLMETHETKASSHFIVGLSGEIIQCMPLNEISYASNSRNRDTISIECCHPGKDGRFNDRTYQSAVQLTAWLCYTYGLDSSKVIRHYDVTGKMCPLYYVRHEDAWKEFKNNVQKHLDKAG